MRVSRLGDLGVLDGKNSIYIEVQIRDERGELLRKGDLLAKEEVSGKFLFVLKEKFNTIFR